MPIHPQIWPAVSKLLDDWLGLPPESREAWLNSLGPEHGEALTAFRSLVEQPPSVWEDFLATLPKLTGADLPMPDGPAPDGLVGSYRLIREIGRGGMGNVWLAERADGLLKRTVALKLPNFPSYSGTLAERFSRERDILAQLNHPHIARLFDAGVTASGQPYLALEYIEGESLIAYCDRKTLGLRPRLVLFVEVLHAVQYAHSNLVVHRDLKPSNIMVAEDGHTRLLDFGIAKLLGDDKASSDLTQAGGELLTPDYASPEQITQGGITTRSDVYSLGVVLYELLTGERPYRLKRVSSDMKDAILATEPARPSNAARDNAKAAARASTPKRLAKTLKGDLDTIVLKALQKEPQQRYETAVAFAEDIERYLHGQTVMARPDSVWYRVRKFAWRNKFAVSAVTAVVLALAVGLGIALWQADRAARASQEALQARDRAIEAEQRTARERDRALRAEEAGAAQRTLAEEQRNQAVEERKRADTESDIARVVTEFLQDDLLAQAATSSQSTPSRKPDPDLTVRAALDRAASRVAGKFESQPRVEAAIRFTIGSAYNELGLYPEAQRQLERALDLRKRVLGPEHPDTLNSMQLLGRVYTNAGRNVEAEGILNDVVRVRQRRFGNTHVDTLEAVNDWSISAGHIAGGTYTIESMSRLLATQRRLFGEDHPNTSEYVHNLATAYYDVGKYPEAERLYKEAIDIRLRTLGPEHPNTLNSRNSLAIAYRNQGEYSQAEPILVEVLDIRLRTLGRRHPSTLESMSSLGILYEAQGDWTKAEQLLTEVLHLRIEVLGKDHTTTFASINNLAELYQRQGRKVESESLFTTLVEARKRVVGSLHVNTAHALASLGAVKLEAGKNSEAEPLLREALEIYKKTWPEHWRRYYTESVLGASLAGLQEFPEAETLLISGYSGLEGHLNSIPASDLRVLHQIQEWLVGLYRATGQAKKAEEWAALSMGRGVRGR
jgi:tetratricopeptide (TPR) repeat protein